MTSTDAGGTATVATRITDDAATAASRQQWWLGAALVVLAAVLHFFRLTQAGALWRDELSTFIVARDGLHLLRYDSFPGLFHVLYGLWLRFTPDQLPWIRLPGTLIGIALPITAFALMNRWRLGVPLVLLGLVALHPVVINWGDSIRAYGLGTLFTVAGVLTFWRLASELNTRHVVAASVLTVCMTQTLYQSCFYVAALTMAGCVTAGMLHRNKAAVLRVLVPGLIAALGQAPYAWIIYQNRGIARIGAIDVTPPVIWETLSASIGYASGSTFAAFLVIISVVAGLACNAWINAANQPELSRRLIRSRLLFCGSMAAMALVGQIAFFNALSLLPHPWYYIQIFAVIAICCDLARPVLFRPGSVQFASILIVAGLNLVTGYNLLQERLTNLDVVGRLLNAEVKQGDMVLVTPFTSHASMKYYLGGSKAVQTLPPMDENLDLQWFETLIAAMTTPNANQQVLNDLGATLKGGNAVWLVGLRLMQSPGPIPPDLPEPPLPNSQWNAAPYTNRWEWQASQFLANHATHARVLRVPTQGPVSPFEYYPAVVQVTGWKGDAGGF